MDVRRGISAWVVVTSMIACDRGATEPPPTESGMPAGPVAPTVFRETFDGDPTAPASFRSTRWDVTVHSRDRETWYGLEPLDADHGPGCEPPPATHAVSDYGDAVYQCRNHVMTALNASGYGLVYLTPDHTVVFEQGKARVEFRVSLLRRSMRDWIDLWISPYDEHLQLALESWLPSLSGEPRNGLSLRLDGSRNAFTATLFRNGIPEEIPSTWWVGYDEFLEPSAMRRDLFVLELSRDHVRFGMPEYDFWWIDTDIAPLAWTEGVVQFGHHSYTPRKDCSLPEGCAPNTWHWDDIVIDPARPFRINRATERWFGPARAEVTLELASRAGSRLRFAGIGEGLELSFDGGGSWVPATLQPHDPAHLDSGHFRSYFTPMPASVTRVLLRGSPWWGGDWHVRDVSEWSRPGG
ncbi:MAG: hypothetical protein R3E98_18750 [Gemmatimonadota bacterium]